MKMLKTGDLLVGSGDGVLTMCSGANFKIKKWVVQLSNSILIFWNLHGNDPNCSQLTEQCRQKYLCGCFIVPSFWSAWWKRPHSCIWGQFWQRLHWHGSHGCFHRTMQLEGGVTSVALRGEGHQFFIGTEAAQIYRFGYTDFKPELFSTNHNSAVKGVAFPLWVTRRWEKNKNLDIPFSWTCQKIYF